jgi:hypothetical protein
VNVTLVVSILYADFRSNTISGVTFNGTSLTKISGSDYNFSGINLELVQYILPSPPLGTYSIVVNANYSVGIIGIASSYNNTSGGLRFTPPNSDSEFGTSTPHSGSYQFGMSAGDMMLDFLTYNSNTVPTPGAGQTVINSNAIGTSYGAVASNHIAASDETFNSSWTGMGGTGFSYEGIVLAYQAPPAVTGGLTTKGV